MVAKLILASSSPARKTLLANAGIDFDSITSHVDEGALVESVRPATVEAMVQLLAQAKAEKVAETLSTGLVLGCDSALEFEGEALGKPLYPDIATTRWHRMSGKSGILHTGHFLIDLTSGRSESAVSSTTVHFAKLSQEEIAGYVATEEPLQVAGAFTIDSLGGPYVERIEGDYHTVVGLSLVKLRQMVMKLGYEYQSLWR